MVNHALMIITFRNCWSYTALLSAKVISKKCPGFLSLKNVSCSCINNMLNKFSGVFSRYISGYATGVPEGLNVMTTLQ